MSLPDGQTTANAWPVAEQDAALLALGRWFVDRAELPLRVASSAQELREVLRLRRHHVEHAGWEPGGRSTSTAEMDDYDATAVHLSAWDGEVLAGTARIILPTSTAPLPTEAAFDLRIEPVGAVVECGRWVVADAYRDRAHRVSMGLSGLACLEVVSRCGATSAQASRGCSTCLVLRERRPTLTGERATPRRGALGMPASYGGQRAFEGGPRDHHQ